MQKNYKEGLCFLCQKPLIDSDRVAVESLRDGGMRYNIKKRREEFKQNSLIDLEVYNFESIHSSCYSNIEKRLMEPGSVDVSKRG